jgi:predicted enzyme related to lactoylglutathione lyase
MGVFEFDKPVQMFYNSIILPQLILPAGLFPNLTEQNTGGKPMTEMKAYTPGTFCWLDLATSDAAAAKTFYTGLMGWTAVDMPVGPDMVYTMCQVDGKDVAALFQQPPDDPSPTHWNSYVSVASADETAAKAKSLGGTVLAEPFDVLDSGRMVVIQDPTGAVVSGWQPKTHIGATLVNQPGALSWNELLTNDTDQASRFYSGLFGWKAQTQETPGGPYTVILNGDRMNGGIMQLRPEWGPMPPNWLVYLSVADCDASADKVKALGGEVLAPPMDIPDTGRIAWVQDPQGAVFAIIKLTNPD